MARSFSITADAFNAYVSWVLPAIASATRAAQAILVERRAAVLEVAAMLRDMLGAEPTRLCRGVVLAPDAYSRGILQPDPERAFLTWTEDREVACWFADPASAAHDGNDDRVFPTLEGFLVEHRPEPSAILFHHAWCDRFPLPGGRLGALADLARLHELIDAPRLGWALATQRVVITLPIASPLVLLDRPASPITQALDARFAFASDR